MSDLSHLDGWHDDPAEVERVVAELPHPVFSAAAPHLAGSGAGKDVLLYKAWKDATGSYVDYPAQVIGCCVSRGWSEGVDLLQAIAVSAGRRDKYTPTSHEALYGMARVDIGGGQLGNQDGAVGAWAAQAVTTIGTVAQDLVGPYDDDLAKKWGYHGVPAELKAKAGAHKVRTTSLVTTYGELEDALANGYPVPVCSNQGFTLQRDGQGFCSPRGAWGHCMLIVGTRNDRPGACIFQSWGPDSPQGPTALDQPSNSFWADRAVVERMLAMRDSFAMSDFDGYPDQTLPAHWSWDQLA